jgi:hypothetical protein
MVEQWKENWLENECPMYGDSIQLRISVMFVTHREHARVVPGSEASLESRNPFGISRRS